jgi:hypothetical protein
MKNSDYSSSAGNVIYHNSSSSGYDGIVQMADMSGSLGYSSFLSQQKQVEGKQCAICTGCGHC